MTSKMKVLRSDKVELLNSYVLDRMHFNFAKKYLFLSKSYIVIILSNDCNSCVYDLGYLRSTSHYCFNKRPPCNNNDNITCQ